MLLKFFSRVVHGQPARVDDSASPCHPLVHALTCSPVQAQWLGSKLRIKLDFFPPNPRAYPKFRRLGGVARIIIIISFIATWRR